MEDFIEPNRTKDTKEKLEIDYGFLMAFLLIPFVLIGYLCMFYQVKTEQFNVIVLRENVQVVESISSKSQLFRIKNGIAWSEWAYPDGSEPYKELKVKADCTIAHYLSSRNVP